MTRTAFLRGVGHYPAGVPNPYIMHVHPYPTRFHGGIWTRPVFGFPQIARTSSVMLPGYDLSNGMTPGLRGLGGWNVGDGIFKPGGYGGGVFDGNLSGLSGNEAEFPWGTYSDKSLQLQKSTNIALKNEGYCPLTEDGKVGKATCGARILLQSFGYGTAAPDVCTEARTPFTFPTKASAGCTSATPIFSTPTAPPTSTATLQPSASMPMSSSTKKALAFMAGGLLAAAAVVYMKKRK